MFRRIKEKLNDMSINKLMAEKDNEMKAFAGILGEERLTNEVKRFIEVLELEPLSEEESAFYKENLQVVDLSKIKIMEMLATVNGLKGTMFQFCTESEMSVLVAMVGKHLLKHDNPAIIDVLLSNKGTGIVNYDVEEVFEIVKRNYTDGLNAGALHAMNELMRIIKPTVLRACINSREVVLYNDDSNGQEIVLQPRDVTAGLVSILLGGER